MSTTTSPRPRVFGARPFHGDGEYRVVAFAPDGMLWAIEEPGILRQWDPETQRQQVWHDLGTLATLWCLDSTCSLVAGGSLEIALWDTAQGNMLRSWKSTSWVTALAFQPGPAGPGFLATGHDDHYVRIWDWKTGRLVTEMLGHTQAISALAYSPDGQILASAGEDRVIRLWRLASGSGDLEGAAFNLKRPLDTNVRHEVGHVHLEGVGGPLESFVEMCGTLAGHTDRIPALVWHPTRGQLISAGWDTTARLWDVHRCEPVILLNSHAQQVHALAVSPDGKVLACADSDNAVHIWNTDSHQHFPSLICVLREPTAPIQALSFSPDSQQLAYAGVEHHIHLWNVGGQAESSARGYQLDRPGGEGQGSLALDPEARYLFGCLGGKLHVYDVRTNQEIIAPQSAPRGNVTGVPAREAPALETFALSPDGRWLLASLPLVAKHRSWGEGERGREVSPLPESPSAATPARTPERGTSEGARAGRSTARATPSAATPARVPERGTSAGARAGRSGARASCDHRNRLSLWEVQTGEMLAQLSGQEGPITVLTIRGDGALAASGSFRSSDVWLWHLPTGTPTLVLPDAVPDCSVEALAFNARGGILAVGGIDWMSTGGSDGQVALWDLTTRQRVRTFAGGVGCLAFRPHSPENPGQAQHLALGTLEQSIRIYNVGTNDLMNELIGHVDRVQALVYSPDGCWLASAGDDRSVRIWDADTGEHVGSTELDTQIKALAFTADGRFLFTGNGNTSCYQLDLQSLLG